MYVLKDGHNFFKEALKFFKPSDTVVKGQMDVGRGEVRRGGVERELGENGMSSSKM